MGLLERLDALVYIKPMHELFIACGCRILLFITGISSIILLPWLPRLGQKCMLEWELANEWEPEVFQSLLIPFLNG